FPDGRALPLLEHVEPDAYRIGFAIGDVIDEATIARLRPTRVFAFAVTYINASEQASVGVAAEVERRHWLISTIMPFWRTYLQVALAAFFINIIGLVSPLFVMNVYDRVLPNAALSTLWVLAAGVTLAFMFELLLKTARASLIDYAGRKADIRLSHMLFDKILNSSLSTRPHSTGEYASRVTQYEFVREFFASNTVATLIDSVFVFVFLVVIYLVAGALVLIPA